MVRKKVLTPFQTMCNTARSYLKVGNDLVLIDDFAGGISDPDYIEGAIELTLKGVPILTREHVDLVDQMWVYLLEAVSGAAQGKNTHFYFPDQPLKFEINNAGRSAMLISVAGTNKTRIASAELCSTIGNGAQNFLQAMCVAVPSASPTWNRYIALSRELISRSAR